MICVQHKGCTTNWNHSWPNSAECSKENDRHTQKELAVDHCIFPWSFSTFLRPGTKPTCSWREYRPSESQWRVSAHPKTHNLMAPWPKQNFKKNQNHSVSENDIERWLKIRSIRVGEMPRWLRWLATRVEDMGSVPTAHIRGVQTSLSLVQENLMSSSCESSVCNCTLR